MIPSDIDPQSGFRLPLPKREDLDEAGKKHYDRATRPGATIAGLQGPAGIQLYSPKTAEHAHALNRYLRLRGRLQPARPRDRDSRRPRAKWTASSNGSRTSRKP